MNPTLLDKTINYFAPVWGQKRAEARLRIEASYRGGVPTRTSELWQRSEGFRFGTSTDRSQLVSARERGINAWRNNPIARTLIQTETDNVIGDGLNYQPTTDSPEWNREAKDRYYEWLETASVRGPDIHSGCELERQLWSMSRAAGDVGWILISRGADSLVQIVPSENIVTPDGKYADRSIYDGIKFDAFGKPTAYFILSNDEMSGSRKFIEIPSRDFVFLPHMSTNSQARGETCFVTIFDLLAHLDRYVDGVSLAAWMATVFGIVFKQENAAKQLNVLGAVTNSQGNQQKSITFENGMVKYIGAQDEVAQVQAHQPMQQTPEFIRTMFRMLGQPFDMPLEVIAKDMSTCNFASARIGLLPFYRSCRIKAAKFGSRWSRTIRWWLSRERQRAQDDPKRWKTAFPENYWRHELLINAWDYTDPVSEAQADLLQIDMGTKSIPMVISERGRDAEQILRDRVEWNEKTKELPQARSTMTRDPSAEAGNAEFKAKADAYGVAVRAGAITPQIDDEQAMRAEAGFPPMSEAAKKAWEEDKGVRRPITLQHEGKTSPFGNQPTEEPQDEQSDTNSGDSAGGE